MADEVRIDLVDTPWDKMWRVGTWRVVYAFFAVDRRDEAEEWLQGLVLAPGTGTWRQKAGLIGRSVDVGGQA